MIEKEEKGMLDSEKRTQLLLTIGPDGGWAWVILFVSTWNCLCIDGVSLGFSVIQSEAMEHQNMNDIQTSLIISVFNSVIYLNGPITAAVANRFGFMLLNVIGGLLGAVGLAMCYFGTKFIHVILCFGVMAGIGGAMIYMVSMACPGYWFETRRSLAFGVSNSASGVAALVIPPICKMITHKGDWRLVYILLAVMLAISFLLGFLILKPPVILVELEQPTKAPVEQKVTMSIINVRASGGKIVDQKLREISYSTNMLHSKNQLSFASLVEPSRNSCCARCCSCGVPDHETKVERPFYRSDIFLQSRTDALAKNANMTHTDYTLSVHNTTSRRDIQQEFRCAIPEAISRPLKEMLSLSLMKNFVYLILLLDTMFYFSAIYVTYLFVPRTSQRKGLDEDTSLLILQLFGAMMATSRILLGLIFHFFPNMPPHYFTGINVFLGGVCHGALSLTTDKTASCIIGATSGFLIGIWMPMRSDLVVRYVGLEKLTNAMGMLFVFQGIGSLYGAPVAEFLRNTFDEDYVTYYFAGTMYALAGALVLPLEILNNIVKKRK